MQAVIFGADNTVPSASVTQYNSLTTCFSTSWNSTESNRSCPVSEEITLTKVIITLDTAPGSGKSYTFAVRDDGANAMTVAVADTNTTNTWTGSAVIAKDSLTSVSLTPSGTPAGPTNVYWQIYYTTAGNSFIMMGGNQNTASASATNYSCLYGFIGSSYGTTDGDYDMVVPSSGTLTALSVASPVGNMGGAGKQYAVTVNRNNGTSDMTATMVNTDQAAQATGSVSWSAGDLLSIKTVPTNTPTARRLSWCVSVTPTTSGETFMGFGSFQPPSTSATNYEQLIGNGNNSWNSSESVRLMRPGVADFKKLYVKLATAPGAGTSRTFTLRDAGADTALTVTISDTNTTGNDTTHTVTHSGGNATVKSVPTSTPAATLGVHIGYVVYVAQSATSSVHRMTLLGAG